MKTITLFVTLLATLAVASPALKFSHFKIRAKSLDGANPDITNLFLTSYHTGAGENVPVFINGPRMAPIFYLNGTRILTKFDGDLPYGLRLQDPTDAYAEWAPMTLNAGLGQQGFSINENRTIVKDNGAVETNGWRICRWIHAGEPELFWNTGLSTEEVNPSNCEFVQLIPQFVKAVGPSPIG